MKHGEAQIKQRKLVCLKPMIRERFLSGFVYNDLKT